jgi:hypothetical protein
MFNIIFPLRFNFIYSKKLIVWIKTCWVKTENIYHNYFCYKNKWIILEYKKRTRYKRPPRVGHTSKGSFTVCVCVCVRGGGINFFFSFLVSLIGIKRVMIFKRLKEYISYLMVGENLCISSWTLIMY